MLTQGVYTGIDGGGISTFLPPLPFPSIPSLPSISLSLPYVFPSLPFPSPLLEIGPPSTS